MKITTTLSTPDRIEYVREDGMTAWAERVLTSTTGAWTGGVDGRVFRSWYSSREDADYEIKSSLDREGWRERRRAEIEARKAARL